MGLSATPNELVRILHLLGLEDLEQKVKYLKLCAERMKL